MVANARRGERYGRGSHRIALHELATADARELKLQLVRTFSSKDYEPPVLPAVAFEVMELSRRKDVGLTDVQAVLETDPLIATRVIKVAQSPLYATRMPVQSIGDAVRRLGLNTIRDVVWQVSMNMRVFRVPGYTAVMERLQRHSIATAHASRIVCDYTAIASEYAFLCGLLHDVGISGILIALAESAGNDPPELDMLLPTIDAVHGEASGHMARMWKLASDLQTVLTHHHGFDADNMPHPLVATLTLAEDLVTQLGYTVLDPERYRDPDLDRVSAPRVQAAMASLGVNDAMRGRIEADVQRVAQQAMG